MKGKENLDEGTIALCMNPSTVVSGYREEDLRARLRLLDEEVEFLRQGCLRLAGGLKAAARRRREHRRSARRRAEATLAPKAAEARKTMTATLRALDARLRAARLEAEEAEASLAAEEEARRLRRIGEGAAAEAAALAAHRGELAAAAASASGRVAAVDAKLATARVSAEVVAAEAAALAARLAAAEAAAAGAPGAVRSKLEPPHRATLEATLAELRLRLGGEAAALGRRIRAAEAESAELRLKLEELSKPVILLPSETPQRPSTGPSRLISSALEKKKRAEAMLSILQTEASTPQPLNPSTSASSHRVSLAASARGAERAAAEASAALLLAKRAAAEDEKRHEAGLRAAEGRAQLALIDALDRAGQAEANPKLAEAFSLFKRFERRNFDLRRLREEVDEYSRKNDGTDFGGNDIDRFREKVGEALKDIDCDEPMHKDDKFDTASFNL